MRVFWKRRRGGAMCPVFWRQAYSLSFALERAPFRQRSVIRIVIAVFTRASTATRAASRGGLARISKETNYDVIHENPDERSFTLPLRPSRRLRRSPSPQSGRRLAPARVTPANNSLAASTGMSGSMTPLAPRRRILEREAGCAARTQTQMLIRPGGRRRDTHGERAASRATRVIAAGPARSTPVIPKVIPSNASTALAPKTASCASIPGRP
jgi:hypothetical protein